MQKFRATAVTRFAKLLAAICIDATLAGAAYWLTAIARAGRVPVVSADQVLLGTGFVVVLIPLLAFCFGGYRSVAPSIPQELPGRLGRTSVTAGAILACVASFGKAPLAHAIGFGFVFAVVLFALMLVTRVMWRWVGTRLNINNRTDERETRQQVSGSGASVLVRPGPYGTQLLRSFVGAGTYSRLAYDFLANAGAGILAILLDLGNSGANPIWAIFLAPPLFLCYAFVLGIYTRYRVAPVARKLALIAVCIAFVGATIMLLGYAPQVVVLYVVLASPILLLPRIFLHLEAASRRSSLIRALNKEREPVLVVGGAGYIGSWLVQELLASNRKVRVLDNLTFGKETLAEFLSDQRFELIDGDVADISKLAAAMNGVSCVVHLAGLVGDPACAVDEAFTRHTNIITTRMVMEIARSFGVERLIFASSCSVYGTSDDEVDETSPLRPVSQYAVTKIDSEKELLAATDDDFHVTILRFATVFGHSRRPRFDLVGNLFVAQAVIDGKITVTGPNQWRPFIHCHDAARAIAIAIAAPLQKVSGRVFNVGDSSLNYTILQLADAVTRIVSLQLGKQIQVDVKDNPQDQRNYRVSFAKIQDILGFRAAYSLESGLLPLVESLSKGLFGNYRDIRYSNVETTREALSEFRDPKRRARLYQPLSEMVN